MNFPAAEYPGYTSAAVSGAVFSEPQPQPQVQVQAQAQAQASAPMFQSLPSTPKLQPISSRCVHTQPVFTNPFAPQSPRSAFSMDGLRDFRPSTRDAEGTARPGDGVSPKSFDFAAAFGKTSNTHHAGTSAYYPASRVAGGLGKVGLGGVNVNELYSSQDDYGGNVDSDEDADEDEDEDGDEDEDEDEEGEFKIGSMFPRMSLDADVDAEGETDSEGEDEFGYQGKQKLSKV
jgi:hypothetical protein